MRHSQLERKCCVYIHPPHYECSPDSHELNAQNSSNVYAYVHAHAHYSSSPDSRASISRF
jgi:hypothetical protein